MSDSEKTKKSETSQDHGDTAPDSVENPRTELSGKIRAAREAAGITVASLAYATRIAPEFIEAFESGTVEDLPGRVFGRGFIRNIAKALEADEAEWLNLYDACWDGSRKDRRRGPRRMPSMPSLKLGSKSPLGSNSSGISNALSNDSAIREPEPRRQSFKLKHGILAAFVCILLGGGAWTYISQSTNKTAPVTTIDLSPMATKPTPASKKSRSEKEEFTADEAKRVLAQGSTKPDVTKLATGPVAPSQTLTLKVLEPVRLKLGIDGQEPKVREFRPNTYTLRFQTEANMLIYDVSALNIEFNGRALGALGKKGRIRRLTFQAQSPQTVRW